MNSYTTFDWLNGGVLSLVLVKKHNFVVFCFIRMSTFGSLRHLWSLCLSFLTSCVVRSLMNGRVSQIVECWLLWEVLLVICDLSHKNVHYGYPFERLKTVHLPSAVHSWSMGCHSNGLDHPFRKNSSLSNGCCYPFEKIFINSNFWGYALKKIIFSNGWGYLFQKIVIHLNGWGYPFEKNCSCSNSWCYPLERNCGGLNS